NCEFDLRQNFNASVVVSSPSFRSRWAQTAFSGWQLSPILTYHSGLWFSPLAGLDNSLTGVGLDRPNVNGDSYIRNTNTLQWLNPAAFSQAPAGTFGDAGRNSLAGPGLFDLDTALSRNFHIRESHQLELRFEFFNVLNHTQFSNPSATLTASTFGEILAAGNPRILQFALKYSF
ncbi:MAG: carboxypeptidase regulatory-like domain-containing protein, partial [Bryobacteraceae bacterium]